MDKPDKRGRMHQSANKKQAQGVPDRYPLKDRPAREIATPVGQPGQHSPEPADEKEEWIRRQLRAVYDETLSEPIPKRFLELLDKIDKTDPESK